MDPGWSFNSNTSGVLADCVYKRKECKVECVQTISHTRLSSLASLG